MLFKNEREDGIKVGIKQGRKGKKEGGKEGRRLHPSKISTQRTWY